MKKKRDESWRDEYWLSGSHKRGRPPLVRFDSVIVKAVQRAEGRMAYRQHQEALRIGREAVKHLGLDEDEPL